MKKLIVTTSYLYPIDIEGGIELSLSEEEIKKYWVNPHHREATWGDDGPAKEKKILIKKWENGDNLLLMAPCIDNKDCYFRADYINKLCATITEKQRDLDERDVYLVFHDKDLRTEKDGPIQKSCLSKSYKDPLFEKAKRIYAFQHVATNLYVLFIKKLSDMSNEIYDRAIAIIEED